MESHVNHREKLIAAFPCLKGSAGKVATKTQSDYDFCLNLACKVSDEPGIARLIALKHYEQIQMHGLIIKYPPACEPEHEMGTFL